MREKRDTFGHILVKVSKREDEMLTFTSYWPELSLVANIFYYRYNKNPIFIIDYKKNKEFQKAWIEINI